MKQATCVISVPTLDPLLDNGSWSFEFECDTATDFTNASAIITACQSFINSPGSGGTNAIAYYLAPSVDRGTNHASVTVYDITGHLGVGARHGGPVATQSFTIGGAGLYNSPEPEGVSSAVSFRADYGTDVEFGGTPPGHIRPRSRDRNRVYVGPLNDLAFDFAPTTNRAKLKAQYITNCLAAMFTLSLTHTAGPDSWNLRVWSRADAQLKLPTEAWMDDRPDYQRRRADQSTSRTFRALASV